MICVPKVAVFFPMFLGSVRLSDLVSVSYGLHAEVGYRAPFPGCGLGDWHARPGESRRPRDASAVGEGSSSRTGGSGAPSYCGWRASSRTRDGGCGRRPPTWMGFCAEPRMSPKCRGRGSSPARTVARRVFAWGRSRGGPAATWSCTCIRTACAATGSRPLVKGSDARRDSCEKCHTARPAVLREPVASRACLQC